jgi:translation elongation factor EF-G
LAELGVCGSRRAQFRAQLPSFAILESMRVQEPVISLAIEPKTKADQEKLDQQ